MTQAAPKTPTHLNTLGARFASRTTTTFCIQVAVTLGLFVVFDYGFRRAGSQPLEAYTGPWPFLDLVSRLGTPELAAATLILAGLALRGSLLGRWDDLEGGTYVRVFVVICSLLLVWPLTTYGYNYLFDEGHYAMRLLLALCVPLLWWRPVFVFPLLVLLYLMLGQLKVYSLGGTILAHKVQVMHVLSLFAATWFLHTCTGVRRIEAFVLLTCCLVASAYWIPFVAKLDIGWWEYGHLQHALISSFTHGWLASFDPETVVAAAQTIAPFDRALQVAVLGLEGGCLFLLAHRKLATALLAGVITFHTAVFFLFGFLFWTWMLLDAALLVLLRQGHRCPALDVFTKRNLAISIFLIATAGAWAKPPVLGWFDTRMNYTYKIDATLVDGRSVRIAPQVFAPYEDTFTMASFGYLSADHKLLVGPYGVSFDREIAEALRDPISPEQLFDIERRLGADKFDLERARQFAEFVRTFITHRNERGAKAAALYALAPPRQFWSSEGERHWGGARITAVRVTEVTTLYDDHCINVVRELPVAHIEIENGESRQPTGD